MITSIKRLLVFIRRAGRRQGFTSCTLARVVRVTDAFAVTGQTFRHQRSVGLLHAAHLANVSILHPAHAPPLHLAHAIRPQHIFAQLLQVICLWRVNEMRILVEGHLALLIALLLTQ
jgi:hypothetical protein